MEKRIKGIKKFFGEFRKFITRGNVLDMAVGVIVGGAFTGIVNGLSNYILKPIINCLLALVLGKDGLTGAVTFLMKITAEDGTVDMTNSIFIDWGAFISAVINFLLIAFVLFMIVRTINQISEMHERMKAGWDWDDEKEIIAIQREQKVNRKKAKQIWEEKKTKLQAQKEEEARLLAEEEAKKAREAAEKAMQNTRLLEEIRDLLKRK